MSGKQMGVALGAGFVCGIMVYLYRVTLQPVLVPLVGSVTGAVGGTK